MRYVVSKNGMYVEKYSCAAERCVLEWTNDVGKAHKFGVNSFMLSRIAGFCFGKPVMVQGMALEGTETALQELYVCVVGLPHVQASMMRQNGLKWLRQGEPRI